MSGRMLEGVVLRVDSVDIPPYTGWNTGYKTFMKLDSGVVVSFVVGEYPDHEQGSRIKVQEDWCVSEGSFYVLEHESHEYGQYLYMRCVIGYHLPEGDRLQRASDFMAKAGVGLGCQEEVLALVSGHASPYPTSKKELGVWSGLKLSCVTRAGFESLKRGWRLRR